MEDNRQTTVYFGGEAHELWTESGLEVTYTGRVPAIAVFEGGKLHAEAPVSGRSGDVKADYNDLARWHELAMRLNSGSVPPLTAAYFRVSAQLDLALADAGDGWRDLDRSCKHTLDGAAESIALIELLRRLLDDKRASWEEATAVVAKCFTLVLPQKRLGAPVPLAAVRALQPRDATLISAVNEKLCSKMWEAWPGDWLRIGESALVRDNEADLTMLAAAMCSHVYCTKEELAGPLRALYTLEPARFSEI